MKTRLLILTALAACTAFAQTFNVTVSVNGAGYGAAAGGSVPVSATAVGQATIGVVTINSNTQMTNVTVTGASAITMTSTPALPATTVSFSFQYLPTVATNVSGLVSIFTANSPTPAFTFNLVGSVPSFALSYSISPNGAGTALTSGSQINFPNTNVGSTTNAVVNVLNTGSAAASLFSTSVSGSAYQITSSPAPVSVAAGQQVVFTIAFTPPSSGPFASTLTVGLSSGTVTFPLSGSGTSPSLSAQYAFADNNVHSIGNGTALTFPSVDINATSSAIVQILNQGTGTGTVSGISISGSGFQLNGVPSLPASIPAGQGFNFKVLFAPTQAGNFTGTLNIQMSGVSIAATLTGSTTSASFTLRYVDPTTSNVLPLSNNGTLSFPNTLAGNSSSVTVQVVNSGSGTGNITSVALGSATAFQLLNLPPLPLPVPPSQQATFAIRFSPAQQQTYTDTLTLNVNGQTIAINLLGQATQAQFTYTISDAATTKTVSSGGGIAIAPTAVGQTSSVVVSISNAGTADGQISGITVNGAGLSLSGLPALPVTLHTGGSQHFNLNFAPTQPGAVSGTLTVGSDTFTVTSTGIGAQLIYSYTSGSSAVPVAGSGVVIFPPLAVGGSESLSFSIQNTGTSPATISTINLTAASTVFALSKLPSLPMDLAAGATATFIVAFSPNNTGSVTASLQVNTSTFTLSGNGNQPASLPNYQFQRPTGTLQAAQQPAIGLTLASPYPSALQGTLTLTFVPAAFADDSSIQFASGGRTVSFTIPANSTQALFNGGSTTIPLQTGTTAGNIVITPSFSMPGGFNLTPAAPNPLTITVPPSAPQLLNASVTAETATSFTLALSGYTTSRTLKELDIQIAPKPGQSFSSTSLTVDVSSTSAAWFQSTVAQNFGGSFLIAIPFTLSNGATGTDLVHLLQSVSISAKNDVGTSSSMTVTIP